MGIVDKLEETKELKELKELLAGDCFPEYEFEKPPSYFWSSNNTVIDIEYNWFVERGGEL